MLFTISGIAVFAMILPAGYVIDKVGRKWATVPSTGIPAIAFLLIPFAESFFQLGVLIAFLGVANGMSLVPWQRPPSTSFPPTRAVDFKRRAARLRRSAVSARL